MRINHLGYRLVKGLGSRGCLFWLPDRQYLQTCYRLQFGKKLNLDSPGTFTEKLYWLKLNEHNASYPSKVDKIEVRDYIRKVLGDGCLIPALWEGDSVKEIPYDTLPDRFVIKCTHGSHCNVICKDKSRLDREKTNRQIEKWLSKNWYWYGREWPYKNIRPRILIEAYMEDANGEELRDYKFFCFNGKVEFCQIIGDRYTEETMDFYDRQWNKLDIQRIKYNGFVYPTAKQPLTKPACYEEMISMAEKLSRDYRFVRIDLYCIKGQAYFSEITFYPADCNCDFLPEEYNTYLGDLIEIQQGGARK